MTDSKDLPLPKSALELDTVAALAFPCSWSLPCCSGAKRSSGIATMTLSDGCLPRVSHLLINGLSDKELFVLEGGVLDQWGSVVEVLGEWGSVVEGLGERGSVVGGLVEHGSVVGGLGERGSSAGARTTHSSCNPGIRRYQNRGY